MNCQEGDLLTKRENKGSLLSKTRIPFTGQNSNHGIKNIRMLIWCGLPRTEYRTKRHGSQVFRLTCELHLIRLERLGAACVSQHMRVLGAPASDSLDLGDSMAVNVRRPNHMLHSVDMMMYPQNKRRPLYIPLFLLKGSKDYSAAQSHIKVTNKVIHHCKSEPSF